MSRVILSFAALALLGTNPAKADSAKPNFVIINIEVLEIVIDGLFGTHRVLSFMGPFYNFLINQHNYRIRTG